MRIPDGTMVSYFDEVERELRRNRRTRKRPTGLRKSSATLPDPGTVILAVGDTTFWTQTGRPVWWNGSAWVYADGTTAS